MATPGIWQCASCNTFNRRGRLDCMQCGTLRPKVDPAKVAARERNRSIWAIVILVFIALALILAFLDAVGLYEPDDDELGAPTVSSLDTCAEARAYYYDWILEPMMENDRAVSYDYELAGELSERSQDFNRRVDGVLGGCPGSENW